MEYRQLDFSNYETRFLRILEPGPSNHSIRAELVTASLTKAPEYSAMSYTWGNEPFTGIIEIDGRDVPVARNVEAALKELSLPRGSLIWIDALCINQWDLYEKSYQVGFMGEVYARADTVIVWLGMANEDTEQAMLLLNRTAQALGETSDGSSETSDLGQRCLKNAIRTSMNPTGALRGLKDLLTRPFWERVWIIQEIAKARRVNVCCGQFQTTIEPIWRVFRHIRGIGLKAEELLGAIKKFQSSQRNVEAAGITLLEAILMTKRSQSTEPRDRVFALLSLTTDGRELVPLPDYSSPLESVFEEISTRILERKRLLAIMLLATRSSIIWQSRKVDIRNLVTVHWAEFHEYLPQWIMLSILQPKEFESRCTFLVQDHQIKTSAQYVGKVKDCENSPSPAGNSTIMVHDRVAIGENFREYINDIEYIDSELNYGSTDKNNVYRREAQLRLYSFVKHLLSLHRRGERNGQPSEIVTSSLLLSPFERLRLLRWRNWELVKLPAVHDELVDDERRNSVVPAKKISFSKSSNSRTGYSWPRRFGEGERDKRWCEVEARLEAGASFGMQFGIVELANPKPRAQTIPSRPITQPALKDGQLHVLGNSAVAFLCRQAKPGDMLFMLPGLHQPVILRSVADRRYRLIGDCILRVEECFEPAKDIAIETSVKV